MPLKTDPKYGYFPWWPEDGDAWIHPEDVPLARKLIPSPRVFRRDGESGELVVLHYGDVRLRVRRTLWQETPPARYEIGDLVEVLSRGMRNTPRTAVVRGIVWDDDARALRYEVAEAGKLIPNLFAAEDLRRVEPTKDLSLPSDPGLPSDDASELG